MDEISCQNMAIFNFDKFGANWSHLEPFWRNFEPVETIWSYVKLFVAFEAIWSYLELFKAI